MKGSTAGLETRHTLFFKLPDTAFLLAEDPEEKTYTYTAQALYIHFLPEFQAAGSALALSERVQQQMCTDYSILGLVGSGVTVPVFVERMTLFYRLSTSSSSLL